VVVKIDEKAVSTLTRGKFVGERTLVTGKLRSASCVAQDRVTAIVMNKKEFLDVNNPMLDWMIPYDAARAVLASQPEVRELSSEKLEALLDHFEPKSEAALGSVITQCGMPIDKLWVFITGTVELKDANGVVRLQCVLSPICITVVGFLLAKVSARHRNLDFCPSCSMTSSRKQIWAFTILRAMPVRWFPHPINSKAFFKKTEGSRLMDYARCLKGERRRTVSSSAVLHLRTSFLIGKASTRFLAFVQVRCYTSLRVASHGK
jgi:hypothetical protein